MVKSVMNLSRNGLSDWLIQRVTAVILAISFIALFVYFVATPVVTFVGWSALMGCVWVKVLGTLVVFSITAHAWVGLWTVLTDYVKPACVRAILEVLLILVLVSSLVWGLAILWG